jgi:HEAT repeat protein
VIEQYITHLRHADATIRYEAAQKLGSSGDQRALKPLIETLPDSNEKVQYAAFSSLLKLGNSEAAAPMISTLLNDLDSRLWSLMKLNIGMRLRHGLLDLVTRGDEIILHRVSSALANKSLDEYQRAFFIRMLGKAGHGEQVDVLIESLVHEVNQVREAAAEALGWIGDPRAYDALLALLTDESDQLREVGIEALGRVGDQRAVAPIIAALKDPSEWVRRAAAEALGNLGDRRAIDPLSEAMHDENEMVQDTAFEALKKFSSSNFTTVI